MSSLFWSGIGETPEGDTQAALSGRATRVGISEEQRLLHEHLVPASGHVSPADLAAGKPQRLDRFVQVAKADEPIALRAPPDEKLLEHGGELATFALGRQREHLVRSALAGGLQQMRCH